MDMPGDGRYTKLTRVSQGTTTTETTQYSFLPGSPPPTFSNSYAYDAASNRTSFTLTDGSSNTYALSLSQPKGSPPSHCAEDVPSDNDTCAAKSAFLIPISSASVRAKLLIRKMELQTLSDAR